MTQRLAPGFLTGLCVFFILLLGQTELFRKAEFYLTDLRFLKRAQAEAKVSISPDILLLTIDEETSQAWPEHHLFWTKYYAEGLSLALEFGATCVGLDMVLTYKDPQGMTKLLTTAIKHRGQLVLGAYLEPTTGRVVAPFPELVAACGVENLALLNLWREFDGVMRAQPVMPIALEAMQRTSFPVFAGRLAEIHRGESFDTEAFSLGRARLPVLSAQDPRIRINYSRDRAFQERPLREVLSLAKADKRSELESLFQGKVVLLGSVEPGDKDAVETPFSLRVIASGLSRRASTPGVRVHAHTLNTLLTGEGVSALSPGAELLLLLLLGTLIAVLCFLASPLWAILLTVAVLAVYWLVAFALFNSYSLLLPLTTPTALTPLLVGVLYSFRYRFVDAQRRHVKSTFSRYVASEVMEEMLKFPHDYDPQGVTEREVTVFFSDINGFSTVCEGRTAPEVTKMLNEHFQEMSEIIFRNQGTLIRFNGDEFMVLFGAPKALPEPEKAAVRTALEMVSRLREMESSDPDGSNGFYRVKIGIHTGPMILTSIGSARRSDYNAIGDGANLASRVMSLAKAEGVSVLVSEDVYEKAKSMEDVEFEPRGNHPVKGREGEVAVYRPSFKSQNGDN